MFHDTAGNVLQRGPYRLEPGQTKTFRVVLPATRAGSLVGIVPCIVPEPGGRTVPSIEVTDGGGGVARLINPAATRASLFQVPAVQEPTDCRVGPVGDRLRQAHVRLTSRVRVASSKVDRRGTSKRRRVAAGQSAMVEAGPSRSMSASSPVARRQRRRVA